MLDFRFSDEQMMVQDALQRFAADRYDVDRRRSYRQGEAGFSADNWRMLAELGLLALPLPIEHGGLGGGDRDILALMVEIGRGLIVEPVLSGPCLGASAIARHGSDAQKARWLAPLVSGTTRLAPVMPSVRHLPGGRNARLSHDGRLTIMHAIAPDAAGAEGFVVAIDDEAGPALAIVPARSADLLLHSFRMLDGSVAAQLAATELPLDAGDIMRIAPADLADWIADGRFAVACEMFGIMERLLADTLDHVRTRKQFGTEIGRFQTIQHRMARLFLAIEQSRSLLLGVAAHHGTGAERRRGIAGAKSFIGDAAIMLAHECVQFHGGMGITDELAVAYGHKRITVLARLFGNSRDARQAYRDAA